MANGPDPSLEAEFEQWLLLTLEYERQRLHQDSGSRVRETAMPQPEDFPRDTTGSSGSGRPSHELA